MMRTSTFGPSLQASLQEPGRARGVGLPRRNNSMSRSGRCRSFRAARVERAEGRPPPPALRSGGGTPAARKPGSAGSRPSSPRPPEDTRLSSCFVIRQHVLGPSDIAGPKDSGLLRRSGGAPRRATAWETEARSVPNILARIVNTEGPRP